jgi:hypothetical protein
MLWNNPNPCYYCRAKLIYSMAIGLLKDKHNAEKMAREGVVVIPFLTPEELAALQSFYRAITQQYALQFTHGMHMTLWHSDLEFKQRIRAGLQQILAPAYQRSFENCRQVNIIFMVKQGHTTGEFAMHHDWSIVDETRFESINVWIPLQDTSPQNGGLWVLKGSHKLNVPIRGNGPLMISLEELEEELAKHKHPIVAKAGEAVLFYHKTIHGSYPNQTAEERVISTFTILPTEAKLRICFQKTTDSPLEVYEPADDFNYKYNDLLNENSINAPGKIPAETIYPFAQQKVTLNDILPHLL